MVSFDLQKVFTPFFYDDAGGFLLVVEGVGRDGFSIECGELFQQVLRGLQLAVFAVAFFLEQ